MKDKNKETMTGEETDRQKAILKMKKVWVSQGWHRPEERLVVAEFGDFVWLSPTMAARQNDLDYHHLWHKDNVFDSEFLAVSNQVRILRKMKDEEYAALNRLYQLKPSP